MRVNENTKLYIIYNSISLEKLDDQPLTIGTIFVKLCPHPHSTTKPVVMFNEDNTS